MWLRASWNERERRRQREAGTQAGGAHKCGSGQVGMREETVRERGRHARMQVGRKGPVQGRQTSAGGLASLCISNVDISHVLGKSRRQGRAG